MIEYLVIILSFGLVVLNIWLNERREARWHNLIQDLLNRKMAKDFYDYVNGTEILNKSQKMDVVKQWEKEALDEVVAARERTNNPPFINQYRPNVSAKT